MLAAAAGGDADITLSLIIIKAIILKLKYANIDKQHDNSSNYSLLNNNNPIPLYYIHTKVSDQQNE